MRKITQNAVNAFVNNENWKSGNTQVRVSAKPDLIITELFLHGNRIAQKLSMYPDSVFITNAGWPTNTTKERLNGILAALDCGGVYQKDYHWYVNGARWDGSWVKINSSNV